MRNAAVNRRKQAWAWLTLLFVVAVVVAAVFFAQRSTQTESVRAAQHPAIGAGASCTSCKAEKHDYVHKAPYQGECSRCHSIRSWTQVSYQHANDDFNQGFHGVVGCTFCHTEKRPQPKPYCGSCHQSKHPVTPNCANCHQSAAWRVTRALPKKHVSLSNGHGVLTCFSCHKGAKAFTRPKVCYECHGSKHGGLRDCGSCHDPAMNGWKPKPGFDHNRFFPLNGRHRKLECSKCHLNDAFAAAEPKCSSCHGSKHGGLTACASCHTTKGFVPSTFKHSSVFRLTGRHTALKCSACHPDRKFARAIGTAGSCVSCHGSQHGGLTACASCHTTAGFAPATFKHSRVWTLTGAHKRLRCSACHPDRKFARAIGKPGVCVSCHGVQHGGLKACGSCHTTTAFSPATFKHSRVWTLTGKHATVACAKCHPGARYIRAIGSTSACTNCHGVKHGNQTVCEKCHTTAGFSPIKAIDHPVSPALSGEHARRSCKLCHPTLVFTDTPKPCSDCHNAPHVAPTDCLRCHRPTVWSDVHFTHSDIGYHTQIRFEDACLWCHTTGDYSKYVCDQCHLP